MTREEAVARIKAHIEIHRYHEQNAVKIIEALDMAIKALEQPERKRGRWIRKERHRGGFRLYTGIDELGEIHTIQVDERINGHDLYCSECGMLCSDVSLNFCSNCGSYNGGNEDE